MSKTKPILITSCALAGIHKHCYMTGVIHHNRNGTRWEIITYNSVRDKVQKLWLSDYCFHVLEPEDDESL